MYTRKTDEFYKLSDNLNKWIWHLRSGIFSKESEKDQSQGRQDHLRLIRKLETYY